VGGAVSAGVLLQAAVIDDSPTARMLIWLVMITIVTGLVLAAGLAYSRSSPSPYMGRIGDILDVVAIMALLPLACGVIGLYQSLQGLFAGVV
jgi:hypothetical protein